VIRVLAVDDHPLVREGIAALIECEEDMELIGELPMGGRRSNTRPSKRGAHENCVIDRRAIPPLHR
jgi:DNA-binding NarL/FixJ family response regulator